jgi:hypothetical protein
MSEVPDARQLLEMAERAAGDGDLSAADELLRSAARVQEDTLGPLHPDLANTLNNLAIVAERTGRLGDADTFYRRAAAIATASLPADDPMVAESRRNLEDFCREHGLPVVLPAVTAPSPDTAPGSDVPSTPLPVAQAEQATAAQSSPPAPRKSSRRLEWVAVGAIVLVTVAALVKRPSSSRDTQETASTRPPQAATPPAPTAASAPIEQPPMPASPPPAVRTPIERAPETTVAPRGGSRADVDKPRPSSRASGDVSLASAQLCQTFSASGSSWRCEPPGEPVVQGPLVLYTRIRSPRDASVVHRWYRDDTLRQAVKLTIRANASEGYRTYSRQRIDGVGSWRVEVRSAEGNLLHEQRFAAR